MKGLFGFILLSTMLVGCDAPQRTRAPQLYQNAYEQPSGGFGGGSTGMTNAGGSTPTTSGSTSGVTSSPGFENCDISDKNYNVDIGYFGVCQSSSDETSFKFRTSQASPTSRICLIPIYKDASGSSTYIGSPQCTYTQANVINNGKLYKDRQNWSQYPINGVIVMRESLTPEYIECMHGYINWPANACQKGHQTCSMANACPYGGGNSVGTPCDNAARTYMNAVCTNFKSKYGSAYTDIRTK